MDLLIDIGNTRIKWAVLTEQRLGTQYAAIYAGWGAAQIRECILQPLSRPNRVLVANVGGQMIGALLGETIKASCGIEAQFVYSSATMAGVHSGYRNPEQLGVDRWLALIGAFNLERRATCVVSIGTAMTVDGIDAAGQHLGGMITPGPDMMIASLYRGTSDIAMRAGNGDQGVELFADNTQAAVNQGATNALASLIERACQDMNIRLGVLPALIITGGASSRIVGALRVPFRLVPDLVLRGLAELVRV